MVKMSDDQYDSKGNSYKKNLDKKYGKGDTLPSWIGRTADRANNGILNFRRDSEVNNSNFWGWLTNGAQNATPDSVNRRAVKSGGNMDPYRSENKGAMGNTSALAKMQAAGERGRTRGRSSSIERGKDLTNRRREAASAPEEDTSQTFMEMLNQALQMSGDGGAAESSRQFAAQRSDLQNRGATADAAIAAMYQQLQGSYGAEAPKIQQSYDQAGQGLAANGATAATNVNTAYDNARDSTTDQLAALGIEDAAGNLAGRGGNAQRAQEMAGQDIAQSTQTAQNQNTANGQAAQTYNTEMGQVAGLTGAATRGRLQGSLSEQLASLTSQEQSSRSQSASNSLAQAMQLAGANMDEQRYNQGREDNLSMAGAQAAQEQAEFLSKQTQDTADATGRAGIPQQVFDLLAEYGLEPGTPEYARTMTALTSTVRAGY
jgi:hypothetical protein